MREIIFRGKRIDNGEWVYGHYFQNKQFEESIIMTWERGSHSTYEVIPETIGQYTGLNDKNGKEIFEGDICKLALNTVSVEYTSGSFKFKCVDKDVWFPLCEFTINQLFPEIIGNIHEREVQE